MSRLVRIDLKMRTHLNQVIRQLDPMLSVTPSDGGFRAVLQVDSGLDILADHFRSGPILPGVCLVQTVLLGVGRCRGVAVRLNELKNAKFLRAAVPGDRVDIHAQLTEQPDGHIEVKANMSVGEHRLAQVSLSVRLVESEGVGEMAVGSMK